MNCVSSSCTFAVLTGWQLLHYISFLTCSHQADTFIHSDLQVRERNTRTHTGTSWGSVSCSRALHHMEGLGIEPKIYCKTFFLLPLRMGSKCCVSQLIRGHYRSKSVTKIKRVVQHFNLRRRKTVTQSASYLRRILRFLNY